MCESFAVQKKREHNILKLQNVFSSVLLFKHWMHRNNLRFRRVSLVIHSSSTEYIHICTHIYVYIHTSRSVALKSSPGKNVVFFSYKKKLHTHSHIYKIHTSDYVSKTTTIYLLNDEKAREKKKSRVLINFDFWMRKSQLWLSKRSDLSFSRSDSLNRTNANAEGRDYSGIVCRLIAMLRSCKC